MYTAGRKFRYLKTGPWEPFPVNRPFVGHELILVKLRKNVPFLQQFSLYKRKRKTSEPSQPQGLCTMASFKIGPMILFSAT
jgi:hypothetical protein